MKFLPTVIVGLIAFASMASENLISNPEFKSGGARISVWGISGKVTDKVLELPLNRLRKDAIPAFKDGVLSQTLTILKPGKYEAGISVKGEEITAVSFWFNFKSSDGKNIIRSKSLKYSAATATYIFNFELPSEAIKADINFIVKTSIDVEKAVAFIQAPYLKKVE